MIVAQTLVAVGSCPGSQDGKLDRAMRGVISGELKADHGAWFGICKRVAFGGDVD